MQGLIPSHLAFLQNLHGWEMFLIFLAFLILFGAKRLPDLARGLGKSIKEFRRASTEVEDNLREAMHADTAKPTAQPVVVAAKPSASSSEQA